MRASSDEGEGSLERAADLLEERLSPAAILLFGSCAEGTAGAGSDVDVGVLLGGRPVEATTIAELTSDLEALVGSEVDLVVLDRASPILCMEVLRSHRVLRSRDPEALEAFQVRTLLMYDDLKRVRAPIERALLGRPKP